MLPFLIVLISLSLLHQARAQSDSVFLSDLNNILSNGCPSLPPISCSINKKYYSHDGTCNNLDKKWQGASNTPYRRFRAAQYDNKINTLRTKSAIAGETLPNARLVSLSVHYPVPLNNKNYPITHMNVMFGQFVAFDLTRISVSKNVSCDCGVSNPLCANIPTPALGANNIDKGQKCMVFTRASSSFPTFDCTFKQKQQLNAATHWPDLSQVYGDNEATAKSLRIADGMLSSRQVSGFSRAYLPSAPTGTCPTDTANRPCFKSGDPRVNENMILTSIFTVFMREHNQIAVRLKGINPSWNSDKIYYETRRILTAMYQNIVFGHFIPILIGPELIKKESLGTLRSNYYMQYDKNTMPFVYSEFGAAAFRYGHAMVNEWGIKTDMSYREFANVTMGQLMLNPTQAYTRGGLDSLCAGALSERSELLDAHLSNSIQNHLFQTTDPNAPTKHFSLSAINIQRGRDNGFGTFNAYRSFCGLKPYASFNEMNGHFDKRTIADMRKVYKTPNDIDLFTGIVSENWLNGAVLGPTGACKL